MLPRHFEGTVRCTHELIASVVSFQSVRCINLSSGVSNCTRRIDTKFARNCILIGHCAQFIIQPTFSNGWRTIIKSLVHKNSTSRSTRERNG